MEPLQPSLHQLNAKDWYCLIQLNQESLDYLWANIRKAQELKNVVSDNLAGNIESSIALDDPRNHIVNFILPQAYSQDQIQAVFSRELNHCSAKFNSLLGAKKLLPVLDSLWVNFQKKYEFNPLHNHSGVFSFVIWMQIPYSSTEESSIHFVKSSNYPSAGRFCFVDSLGESTYIDTPAGTQGLMCIFPSFLKHIVYPFYTSSDYRISVSGNITFELA